MTKEKLFKRNSVKSQKELLERLESKKKRLRKIVNSGYPKNWDLAEAHERLQHSAPIYLDELEEATAFIDSSHDIKLVTEETFFKQIQKADYSNLALDGMFCKLALIQNFPYDDLWLLTLKPMSSL